MRIAIVEDDDKAANQLKKCIQHYATKHQLTIDILVFNDGVQITSAYPDNLDIIYFDVQMPVMDGMTAAKKIRQHDPQVLIVFLTNYVQYAIDGYEVQAADFLLKPVTEFSFSAHFDKLRARIGNHDRFVTVKHGDEIDKIILSDLYYIESAGHYLNYHTKDKVYKTIGSLKNASKDLADAHFFRCNYGYLVNLALVTSVSSNTVHVGPFDLQISRSRKKDFMAALANYLGTAEL
ncbi:LytTR family DNA-binding domain-containing protein [uncultured Limosilactobacillus sp.]|uniref:LytR/AlgR family response regulator transcription factor n=1 Tax=uncultured Limosilactobacillus sp. TaxID=2837629 RepID=UPI0025F9BA6D|nr:LytTR family DNA-binding domain-containing protein [uncultured Limosilactobacillus sp.]